MILKLFASGSVAATGYLTKPTPVKSGEKNRHKKPQKGDFIEQMSFAIPSLTLGV